VIVAGIMQHIEEAGVHSGDSACSLPPYSLPDEIVAEIARQSEILARALGVRGLMNVQFAVKDGLVYIIEVNPRASRTVPFVAKAIGAPVAKMAALVMAGVPVKDLPAIPPRGGHIAVKEAVFPFARFAGVDPALSPEMKSTGEVMGLDADFPTAFAKAQLGAGLILPAAGCVFVSVKGSDKPVILPAVQQLAALGFSIVATDGTADFLAQQGLTVTRIHKVAQGSPHIVDAIQSGTIAMIFNTTEGWQSLKDSESIRRSALMARVPQFTTASASVAAAQAIAALQARGLEVRALQSYHLRLAS
jgi:carbamoyl-phosphate synthase large subunit